MKKQTKIYNLNQESFKENKTCNTDIQGAKNNKATCNTSSSKDINSFFKAIIIEN